MTWHVDDSLLAAYQAGDVRPAQAASVESHLMACDRCRSSLAATADPQRLAANWVVVEDRLDDRRQPLIERILLRAGVPEHHARLVITTPAARMPTALGSTVLFAAVVALANSGTGRSGWFYAFLVGAPLLPLAGVAAAFGGRNDPVRELAGTTPTPAFELLLARVLAIGIATSLLCLVATAALPGEGWAAAAWLLPALGLSATSLALSTWVPAHWSSTGLGAAWVAAAVVSWRLNRFDPDVAERFLALRPAGQVVFAALAAAGALVLVMRRETLEFRRVT